MPGVRGLGLSLCIPAFSLAREPLQGWEQKHKWNTAISPREKADMKRLGQSKLGVASRR